MKRLLLFVLTAAALVVFLNDHISAQVKKKFDFSDFSKVSAGWGMYVNVSQGSEYNIEVEADSRDLEVLKVEKKKNTLKFFIDKSNYRKHGDININIKMPVLTDLKLSGGSHGIINMNIASKDFEADLSGGAELKGELQCGDISFECSGGSTVTLKGKANNLSARGSGGSEYDLKNFPVKDVNADLSGGSNLTVTSNGTINSDQDGGSEIVYYGNAKIGKTDFSGGSGITRGE
jgi:hypothetical protein